MLYNARSELSKPSKLRLKIVDVPPVEEDIGEDAVRQAADEKFYDSGVYD